MGGTLTPAHFLSLRSNLGFPHTDDITDPDFSINASSSTSLLNHWKKGQHYLRQFWSSFQSEYLQALRERPVHNPAIKGEIKSEPVVGQVVLIRDKEQPREPRGVWKMGKINRLYHSPDEAVRSAAILLPSGIEIRRPVTVLHPLEVTTQPTVPAKPVSPPADPTISVTSPEASTRPQRATAQRCRDMIRQLKEQDTV